MKDRTREGRRGSKPAHTRRALLLGSAALLALPLIELPGFVPFGGLLEAKAAAPDFSGVTTSAAARRLVREGWLVEISLFPTELGGSAAPQNLSYTTPEAAEARATAISSFRRFVEDGLIDQLDVVPDYKGDSIVPSSITMTGTHSEREGAFRTTITVW